MAWSLAGRVFGEERDDDRLFVGLAPGQGGPLGVPETDLVVVFTEHDRVERAVGGVIEAIARGGHDLRHGDGSDGLCNGVSSPQQGIVGVWMRALRDGDGDDRCTLTHFFERLRRQIVVRSHIPILLLALVLVVTDIVLAAVAGEGRGETEHCVVEIVEIASNLIRVAVFDVGKVFPRGLHLSPGGAIEALAWSHDPLGQLLVSGPAGDRVGCPLDRGGHLRHIVRVEIGHVFLLSRLTVPASVTATALARSVSRPGARTLEQHPCLQTLARHRVEHHHRTGRRSTRQQAGH